MSEYTYKLRSDFDANGKKVWLVSVLKDNTCIFSYGFDKVDNALAYIWETLGL